MRIFAYIQILFNFQALLEFDDHRRIKRVDEKIATLLMLGLLVCRGLVLMVILSAIYDYYINDFVKDIKWVQSHRVLSKYLSRKCHRLSRKAFIQSMYVLNGNL